jgi:transcriptional regulator GlxA family with amidase domain
VHGASVLAAAGLLDGRRATTHWTWAARLARRHPAVHVDPAPIFVRDGPLSTAAGVTSPLDARVRRGGPPEAIWRGWWPAAW